MRRKKLGQKYFNHKWKCFLVWKSKFYVMGKGEFELSHCTPSPGLFSSVQSLSFVWLFATPWTVACQASLSITNSRSLLKLMSMESVMLPSHLILCRPLLLLPSIFPSTRVFTNESVLHIRWSKYWSFSISPSNEYSGLISFRIDWFNLLAVQGTLKSSPTPQFKSISSLVLSFVYGKKKAFFIY